MVGSVPVPFCTYSIGSLIVQMPISPEDVNAGGAANARIKSYELLKRKRLVIYLIPGVWMMSSLARYEARANSWNCFQLIFWSLILITIIIFDIKRKRQYARDFVFLTQLRHLYGNDVSFEIKTPDPGKKAEGSGRGLDRLTGRGFKPLIEFGIILALAFGLRYLIDSVWPLLK